MPANGRWDLIRRLKVNHCATAVTGIYVRCPVFSDFIDIRFDESAFRFSRFVAPGRTDRQISRILRDTSFANFGMNQVS